MLPIFPHESADKMERRHCDIHFAMQWNVTCCFLNLYLPMVYRGRSIAVRNEYCDATAPLWQPTRGEKLAAFTAHISSSNIAGNRFLWIITIWLPNFLIGAARHFLCWYVVVVSNITNKNWQFFSIFWKKLKMICSYFHKYIVSVSAFWWGKLIGWLFFHEWNEW